VTRKSATAEADTTYIATGKGSVYLTCILDVYSRRIVRWAMESRPTAGCDDGCTRYRGNHESIFVGTYVSLPCLHYAINKAERYYFAER
jgi:hypothetical protein